MKRTVLLIWVAGLAAGMMTGCEKKFTEKRFDTMIIKGQSQMEVEKILGEPTGKMTNNAWKWVDFDEGYSGKVLFDKSGKVIGKKFTNSKTMRDDPDPEAEWTEEDRPSSGNKGSVPSGSSSEKTTMEVTP
jgi:hypothetical protein